MSIYKDCDIRGIYGTEWNEDTAYEIGRAIGSMAEGVLCVGGDVRLSTPVLKGRLIQGLRDSGTHVADIGKVPTPAFYYALANRPVYGGVMVTASHNPAAYNGFKVMLGSSPVTRMTIDEVERRVREKDYKCGNGFLSYADILPAYKAFLLERFHGIKRRKVVIDSGNGSMSEIAPEVFRGVGCDVVELYCTFDGHFPNRSPNPAEYSCLGALCEEVRRSGADFGVAFDGDGDRVVFVDEAGNTINSERSFVLLIRRYLRRQPAPVVYDLKSSSVVKKAIREMGGEPLMERSGHTFIKKRFLDHGAALAGEISGHFFFRELGYDDGLYAALVMARILSDAEKPLSSLLSEVVCPPITPDLRIDCPYPERDALLERFCALGGEYEVSRLDGVRIEFPFGWLLVRKSVTAEQITLRMEAADRDAMEKIKGMVLQVMPGAAGYLRSL